VILGMGGGDTIEGGDRDDILAGNGGSDTVDGGSGTDTCDAEIAANCEL